MSGVQYVRLDPEDEEASALYDVAKVVGIRFSRAEEPFMAAIDDDGRVVGGTAVASYEDEGWSFSVVVLPGSQGRGVGAELIREVVRAARAEDVRQVSANVVNERLRPHLRRLGFVDDPVHRGRMDLNLGAGGRRP